MEIFNTYLEELNISEKDVDQIPPLVLAFIGDAVYEVLVRMYVVSKGRATVHNLHKGCVSFVKAKAQADIVHAIHESLTSEEQDIVRRGRNQKSGSIPKNADVTDYKYATGYETLIGYLFLKKRNDRLLEIFKMGVEKVNEKHL